MESESRRSTLCRAGRRLERYVENQRRRLKSRRNASRIGEQIKSCTKSLRQVEELLQIKREVGVGETLLFDRWR
jgi:DNA topoisomerase VI subunit B